MKALITWCTFIKVHCLSVSWPPVRPGSSPFASVQTRLGCHSVILYALPYSLSSIANILAKNHTALLNTLVSSLKNTEKSTAVTGLESVISVPTLRRSLVGYRWVLLLLLWQYRPISAFIKCLIPRHNANKNCTPLDYMGWFSKFILCDCAYFIGLDVHLLQVQINKADYVMDRLRGVRN
jgi:hypothetical protein